MHSYHSFMFKTIATAAIAAVALLTATPGAEASQVCHDGTGHSVCFRLLQRRGNFTKWRVGFANNHATEALTVVCNGNYLHDWRSNGDLNHSEANFIATAFCAE